MGRQNHWLRPTPKEGSEEPGQGEDLVMIILQDFKAIHSLKDVITKLMNKCAQFLSRYW